MKKITNPELTRNLWLNFSSSNAFITPLIIAIMAFPIFLIFSNTSFALSITSLIVFYIAVVIFGMSSANSNIQNEINNNTWDFQRMSSASAIEITLGKFIGGISYTWYIGFITLIIFIISTYIMGQNIQNSMESSKFIKSFVANYQLNQLKNDLMSNVDLSFPLLDIIKFVSCIFISVLFGQSILFFCSIPSDNEKNNKINNRNILSIIISTFLIIQFSSLYLKDFSTEKGFLYKVSDTISWYGYEFNSISFLIISIFIGLFFTLFGSYRVIKRKLQYKTTPVFWSIFVIFFSCYLSGLVLWNKSGLIRMIDTMSINFIFLFYIIALKEVNDISLINRFINSIKLKNWGKSFQNMPMWVPTIFIFIVAYIFSSTTRAYYSSYGLFSDFTILINAMLFLIRDICAFYIISIKNYFGKRKNIYHKNIIYIIIMYIALPMIMNVHFSYKDFIKMEQDNGIVSALFYPSQDIITPAIVTLLFIVVLRNTIKKHFKKET